ncbi:MAG: SAM-dependent methyltransferase [Actinomycetia bacterium]|nr:SAM-dependent methyltransferase [Actinomycetes bacterium]
MKEKLIARISRDGPLYFDDYMEACLYDPDDGFYSSGRIRPGEQADFLTSPEISPWFGVLVGGWATSEANGEVIDLVEVGAGSGALFKELDEVAGEAGIGLVGVEVSESARRKLRKDYPDSTIVATLGEVRESARAVVIANELLDNLPAALARKTRDGWAELVVSSEGTVLVLEEVAARSTVAAWCDAMFPNIGPGGVVTAQLAVERWIETVLRMFGTVSLCIIDYAATAEELSARNISSLVRSYREQQTDLDWLSTPGENDITVDVNIDGVLNVCARLGASVVVKSQRAFLLDLGADELVADQRDMEYLHASGGRVMEQLMARSERIAIEALLEEDGLGGFTVFIISRGV